MSDFPEPTQNIRRHTGAVGLVLEGERPLPKDADEILALASTTEFYEDRGVIREYEGGSVEFAPPELSSNAVVETIMEGRLLYRFTITGDSPVEYQILREGTYFMYVDFIEGPDLDEGRWIGRIISEKGELAGLVPGVEVKQVFSFHIDERQREEHQSPRMGTHGLGVGEVALRLGFKEPPIKSTDKWIVTHGDWTPHGNGCATTFYCTPAQVVAIDVSVNTA